MSIRRPIFNRPLLGKAGREVMNDLVESASIVMDGQEAIADAHARMFAGRPSRHVLAKATAASSLATNRWTYNGVLFTIDGSTPVEYDGGFEFTEALNIRELRNNSTRVDGSPLPGGASIGPVGSSWDEDTEEWPTTDLEGYIWLHVEHKLDGTVLFWFNEPNPVVCT